MPRHHIAFWNVENLFDVEDSEHRPEWLQNQLKSQLKDWDETVLNKKLLQLASVIERMNDDKGPDILGVCEIENQPVLEKLVAAINLDRNYQIAHHDTSDNRGIDVAFIYDADRFTTNPDHWFFRQIVKRSATRDIFQITFTTQLGNELILVGNHWPARLGGQYKSEPYRMIAGETLAYWHERVREIKGDDVALIAMGDFNDEPFNRSLTEYGLSTRLELKVEKAKSPKLFNLMWPLMGQGQASHYYNNSPNMLDQFLASKGVIEDGPLAIDLDTVAIVKFDDMHKGQYESPRAFGRPSRKLDESGFSDHFPIEMDIVEAE
jgi:hypothetical protein